MNILNKFRKPSLSIFLASLVLFVSCDEEIDPLEVKSKLSAKDIAKYHNIALGLYENSKSGNNEEKFSIVEIQQSVTNLMKENYPDLMKGFIIPQQSNFLSSNYVVMSSDDTYFDFNSFLTNGLNTLVSENKISNYFAREIMNLTVNEVSFSKKLEQIEILRKLTADTNENNFLDIFESTLLASNEYWNDSNYRYKLDPLNCGSQVVAADAVGAGLGLYGGPVWSIIQGAVVSIAVSEDCEEE